MNKKITVLKLLLLLAGYAIIATAFYLFKPEEITNPQKFMWINIVCLYSVFELFILFSRKGSKFADRNLPTLFIGYAVVAVILIAGIILTVLVAKEIVSIKLAVFLEILMLFVVLMILFWGLLGNYKIRQVAVDQKAEYQAIKELRSSMESLKLKSQILSGEYSAEKESIEKICEEIQYLSPVGTAQSENLESEMITAVMQINSIISEMQNGVSGAELKNLVSRLDSLYKQRKLLRK